MITIHQSIFINKPAEAVWDFTQNYDNRAAWDDTVLEATVLQTQPHRVVKLKIQGKTEMTFVYKLDERPSKTSLAAKDIHSSIIEKAGGHWVYETQNGGTLWMQTNSIVLKKNIFLLLLSPFFKWMFAQQTKKAMRKAKGILERP